MRRRLLSTLLVLCMVLSLLPETAWAADAISFSEPQVTRLTVSWDGGEPVELLGAQPTVSMPVGSKPVFTVKFDKTDMIDQVFVTSTKDGKTEYLEAIPKSTVVGTEYVTDGYFDESNHNYVPGTIAVTYSKIAAKVDETRFAGSLEDLRKQLEEKGIYFTERSDDSTLENVLVSGTIDMLGEKFDAEFGELADALNFDDSAVKTWLGLIKDVDTLFNYELEDASGANKFIMYLADGDDLEAGLRDTNTYLVFIKDVTNNKYTKLLLKQAADSGNKTLSEIAGNLSAAGTVTKTLLEYNAISEEMDNLREEIRTNQEMTEAQKKEADAEIDKLERDKQKFLVAMTAVTVMTTSLVATASAPLMISAIIAGYSAIAPYFWEHRIGLIKGCDPIEDVFSNEHGDVWIQLNSDYLYSDYWNPFIEGYIISKSGYYYLSQLASPQIIYIGISDDAESVIDPIDVTICLHGYSGFISVYNGSTIHICDCKYREDENGNVVAGGTLSGVDIADKGQLIVDRVNIIGTYPIRSYGGEVVFNSGSVTSNGYRGAIFSQNRGNITINGGTIHGGVCAKDGGNITINDGAVTGYADVHNIDKNAFARDCGVWTDSGKITVNKGTVYPLATETGEITVNNGQIANTYAGLGKVLGISNYNGTVNILDGTISGIYNEKGTVNVRGGTITYYSGGITNGTDGTVNVTGGVISSGISNKGVLNISGGLITGDRRCVENDNGKVTIFAGTLDGRRDNGSVIVSAIETKGTDSVVAIKGGIFYGSIRDERESGDIIISNGTIYGSIYNRYRV